jgi:hypothetical protein
MSPVRAVYKAIEQIVTLCDRYFESVADSTDMLPGPAQDLPAVWFALPQNFRDFHMFIAKHLMQKEYRALDWCKPF